jgi:hypothetical protein
MILISICIYLFLFPVGLDIHQKFTVFYFGPRKFVNETAMERSSETDISHSDYSGRATATGSSKGK